MMRAGLAVMPMTLMVPASPCPRLMSATTAMVPGTPAPCARRG
jgi:hypothetical protein